MKRFLIVVALGSLALLGMAGTAVATPAPPGPGNSAAAHACQNGGWQNLITSDGQAFASEDDCVAYAAHGNRLAPKPTATLVFNIGTCTGGGSGVHCYPFTVTGSGLQQNAAVVLCQDGTCTNQQWGTVAPDGTFNLVTQVACVQGADIYFESTSASGTPIFSNHQTCAPNA